MLLVGTSSGLYDLDAGPVLLDRREVTGLAAGPLRSHALLDRRIVVSVVGHEVSTVGQLPEADGQSLAALADGRVVVGRRGARLAAFGPPATGPSPLEAFERVPGRDGWKNPANPTPDSRSLAARGDDLWVNVHVGGLWHSANGGRSWRGEVEPEADIHEVRAGPGWVAVAAAAGFAWSADDGASWSWTTEGLHAHYLRAVAVDRGTAWVSASDGPFTRRGALYRAPLGSPFERCRAGLPDWFEGNVDSGHLDAAGGRVAVGFGEHVHLSDDGGASWRAVDLDSPVRAVRFGG